MGRLMNFSGTLFCFGAGVVAGIIWFRSVDCGDLRRTLSSRAGVSWCEI